MFGELDAPAPVAKAASRQMLGFMNEMARRDVGELNHQQRRMPPNRDGRYATPLDLVAEHDVIRARRGTGP